MAYEFIASNKEIMNALIVLLSIIYAYRIVELQFKKTCSISYEDLLMSDFHKDIFTGLLFITGLLGFIYGEFIISTVLFATAAIISNVNLNHKRVKAGQFSCD
jgi:Na+/proline symporter